jgi:bifunctional non-homologous end joining protein LigD
MQPKYDGWRFLWAVDSDGAARAWTRSGRRRDGCFPELDDQLRTVVPPDTILDSELVALREGGDGRVLHDFKAIAPAISSGCAGLHYVVFDVLRLGAASLLYEPWQIRRATLLEHLDERRSCVSVAQVLEPSLKRHEQLVELGFEGSVFKRADSRYLPGRRSQSWLKLKARFVRDVVIDGFGPRGDRIERIRCKSLDGMTLCWAELWSGELRRRVESDPRAWIGRPARVAFSSRAAGGELREARVLELLS